MMEIEKKFIAFQLQQLALSITISLGTTILSGRGQGARMWDFHSHFFCKFADTPLQLINARSHLINFCDNGVRHSLEPGLHLLEKVLNKSSHICSALSCLSWFMTLVLSVSAFHGWQEIELNFFPESQVGAQECLCNSLKFEPLYREAQARVRQAARRE